MDKHQREALVSRTIEYYHDYRERGHSKRVAMAKAMDTLMWVLEADARLVRADVIERLEKPKTRKEG